MFEKIVHEFYYLLGQIKGSLRMADLKMITSEKALKYIKENVDKFEKERNDKPKS